MINHLVLMKFKEGVGEAEVEELEKSLDDLPNKIIEIHSYEFGRDRVHSERSYDFGLVSLFANLDTLQRYQKHPEHLKVLEKIKKICNHVITVDFESSNAGSLKFERPF
jgi:hypothetical protein